MAHGARGVSFGREGGPVERKVRSHKRRTGLLVAAGALALAAFAPQVASAATLTSAGGVITYSAAPGETNALTITATATDFSFAPGTGITTTPTAPCVGGGSPGTAATCPRAGITTITVFLDDMNDSLTASSSGLPSTVAINANGGDGNDTLTTGSAINTLAGGPGNDTFTPGGGNDVVAGGDGDDLFVGGALPDGNDSFNGGGGNDLYLSVSSVIAVVNPTGTDGSDDFVGGPGAGDTMAYVTRSLPVTVNLVDNTPTDGQSGEGDNVHSDVENVITSGGSDTVTGNAANNLLVVGNGNNVVDANAGNDIVTTGSGSDTVYGRAGTDIITDGGGADLFRGHRGADVFLSSLSTTNDVGDVYNGGPDTDLVAYSSRTHSLYVNLKSTAKVQGETGEKDKIVTTEGVLAGNGNDTLLGNNATNLILDGGGNDYDEGWYGDDLLVGGAGDDTLHGDNPKDLIRGGSDIITGGPGHDDCDGGPGIDIFLCDDEDTVEITDGDEDALDQAAINLLIALGPTLQGLESQLGPLNPILGPVIGPVIDGLPPLPLPVPISIPDFQD